ncbi:hypothetical protein DEH42_15290 [Salmonella enterica]|nr:hypothetical protein [Salmonella enterica]
MVTKLKPVAFINSRREPVLYGEHIGIAVGTHLYTAPPEPEYPETLPCPVHLVPGLRFDKGCKTEGLLIALQRRAEYYAELDAMTPEERAKHDERIAEFKSMLPRPVPIVPEDLRRSLEAVARLNNEMYRWTSCLSYNGSYVGELEGLFKRNIREIEHILDNCINGKGE